MLYRSQAEAIDIGQIALEDSVSWISPRRFR